MADTSSGNVIVGTPTTLTTALAVNGVPTDATGAVSCVIVGPDGTATVHTVDIVHPDVGTYELTIAADAPGIYHWRWLVQDEAADEGYFTAETAFGDVTGIAVTPPDLLDLWVLVAAARRRCEGPWGPPTGRAALSDEQLYGMVADACAQVILNSGSLFGHNLVVKARDPLAGFATQWQTEAVLDEWEVAVITCQAALTYFFFVLRDLRPTVSVKNEGTEYTYSLGVSAIRDYLDLLKQERDDALAGLVKHHPVLDRYASNIRVRDQATVALLEWWDTNSPDAGGGMPGGQEAAVIPWIGGVAP